VWSAPGHSLPCLSSPSRTFQQIWAGSTYLIRISSSVRQPTLLLDNFAKSRAKIVSVGIIVDSLRCLYARMADDDRNHFRRPSFFRRDVASGCLKSCHPPIERPSTATSGRRYLSAFLGLIALPFCARSTLRFRERAYEQATPQESEARAPSLGSSARSWRERERSKLAKN
jgi:hypothetical protein